MTLLPQLSPAMSYLAGAIIAAFYLGLMYWLHKRGVF